MAKRTDFIYSEVSEPHRKRTKLILKQFPHLRNLIGKNPGTIFYIIGLVSFQVVLAWLLRDFGNHGLWLAFLAFMLLRSLCLGVYAYHLTRHDQWFAHRLEGSAHAQSGTTR